MISVDGQHKREKRYFVLNLISGASIWLVFFLLPSPIPGLVGGSGIVFILLHCLMKKWILENGQPMGVSHPLFKALEEAFERLRVPAPQAFILTGGIKSRLCKMFLSRAFMLLDGAFVNRIQGLGVDETEVFMLREAALCRLGRHCLWEELLLFPVRLIPFISAEYRRVCEVSADRVAAAASGKTAALRRLFPVLSPARGNVVQLLYSGVPSAGRRLDELAGYERWVAVRKNLKQHPYAKTPRTENETPPAPHSRYAVRRRYLFGATAAAIALTLLIGGHVLYRGMAGPENVEKHLARTPAENGLKASDEKKTAAHAESSAGNQESRFAYRPPVIAPKLGISRIGNRQLQDKINDLLKRKGMKGIIAEVSGSGRVTLKGVTTRVRDKSEAFRLTRAATAGRKVKDLVFVVKELS
jgi:hypothetical protein